MAFLKKYEGFGAKTRSVLCIAALAALHPALKESLVTGTAQP